MIVLTVTNIVQEFDGVPLFSPLSFEVNSGDRMALIGANGCGKSTILKILTNRLELSKGSFTFAKNEVVGYLSQDVIQDLNNTVHEEALLVFEKLIEQEAQLKEITSLMAANPTDMKLIEDYGKKESTFGANGGYDYRYLIDMMLTKFGFTKEDYKRKIGTFSGGERTKMAFAKLLLIKPSILVLDEPTNHLDIETIDWLETYLKTYSGTILFVSHDHYFINSLANKVLELENGKIELYKGDYTFYQLEKQKRYELQLKAYKNQQAEIAKLKRFIEYFMPKPRFVSRAHDREKKLERIKEIDKPTQTHNRLSVNFQGETRTGKKLISFEHLGIGYTSTLIGDIDCLFQGGDKLALMGNNGCGKTTLLKTLMGELEPTEGRLRKLVPLKIGYLQQNDFNFDDEKNLVDTIYDEGTGMQPKEIYNHLARYGFDFEDDFKKVGVLSGGEKMKLMLAIIVLRKYDILLLDEPTNHLDILSKEELIHALQDYDGSLIIVSHDRYFVDQVANKILYVHKKLALYYEGRYSDFKVDRYDALLSAEEKDEVMTIIDKNPKTEVKKVKKVSKLKLEEMVEVLEKKLAKISELEMMEENYMDSVKMKELDEESKRLTKEYEELFDELASYEE